MNTDIMIALITGITMIVSNVIVSKKSIATSNEVIKVEIKQLKDQVNKHNNIIERTYKLETEVANIKEVMRKWS